MANAFFVGSFAIGDKLDFIWTKRNNNTGSETDAMPDAATASDWVYDVIDLDNGSIMFADEDLDILSGFSTSVFYPAVPLDVSEGNGFTPGRGYGILAKNDQGTGSTTELIAINFRVTWEHLGSPNTTDALAETAGNENTILGRLRTLERNQTEVIFPRLQRNLGLSGENQLVDAYSYDNAGNIMACRIRVFDTRANALAAAIWQDTENEADPAPTLQTGEILRYIVTADHVSPRQLRQVLDTKSETDPADAGQTGSVM
jgi:hypothetical protein